MSCGVGCRRGLDPELLWLRCSSDSTRSLGTSICCGSGPKKGKKTKKKKKKRFKNIRGRKTKKTCSRKCSLTFLLILQVQTLLSQGVFPDSARQGQDLCYMLSQLILCFFPRLLAFSRAAPTAYGGSQARGQIGAAAACLHQSHSNAGSKPRPQPTP